MDRRPRPGTRLDLGEQRVSVQSLSGGYIQAMVNIDSSLGSLMPYAKFQTYDGAAKFDTNAPHMEVDEAEMGVEWQIRPEIELTTAYAHMERTTSAPYEVIDGDLLRLQSAVETTDGLPDGSRLQRAAAACKALTLSSRLCAQSRCWSLLAARATTQ